MYYNNSIVYLEEGDEARILAEFGDMGCAGPAPRLNITWEALKGPPLGIKGSTTKVHRKLSRVHH